MSLDKNDANALPYISGKSAISSEQAKSSIKISTSLINLSLTAAKGTQPINLASSENAREFEERCETFHRQRKYWNKIRLHNKEDCCYQGQ